MDRMQLKPYRRLSIHQDGFPAPYVLLVAMIIGCITVPATIMLDAQHVRTNGQARPGYLSGQGAGGVVTQITSKATGVTLNTATGDITLNAASLAAATVVSFTLTNSFIAASDCIFLQHQSVGTFGSYTINAAAAAGSASISIRNNTAGALAEAIVIRFAVVKCAQS